MFIKEEEPKLFYLKNGLINGKIKIFNNNYKVYQVIQSDNSSSILTTKNIYHFAENNKEEVLYNFGNYSFESEMRNNFKSDINNKSYGYDELDFVLKNDSNNDIVIENEN